VLDWKHRLDSPQGFLKTATRNSQFDFTLIKLRKFELVHQQTTWMQLPCMPWFLSPILLNKIDLEELEFS